MSHWWILLAALALDAVAGDPDWLWRRVRHPVVILGAMIGSFERRFNDPTKSGRRRRRAGLACLLAMLGVVSVVGVLASFGLGLLGMFGDVVEIALVAVLLAQRSLALHVRRVADGIRADGVAGGRLAVAMIVGRDVGQLNESGTARAAIESLAENFSDGVVAPAFWYLVGGLPLLLAYKFVNTADSMIGHLDERHADFGRSAALLDDAMNWLPARLSALFVLASKPSAAGLDLRALRRDARRHRSPNAGWPETAMAQVAGLALGGPRSYGAGVLEAAILNPAGTRRADVADIEHCVALFWRACAVQALLVAVLAVL